MRTVATPSAEQLDAGLAGVQRAPADVGTLELIVARPAEERRELLERAALDESDGLVGDMWSVRPSPSSADGGPNPDAQVTAINARAAELFARSPEPLEWAQAGDQLYVDLDLSERNLPPGSRIRVGEAVLEVSSLPHLGCGKFARRFGVDALKFVNSGAGRAARLRGLNARVVVPGVVRRGDPVRKLDPA